MSGFMTRFLSRLIPRHTGVIVAIIMVAVVLLLIGIALAGMNGQSSLEHLQIAEQAIERAARQCYALEGAYPPDLAYLESDYGLILDWENYHYFYEVIGSNIKPIIEVQVK